MDYNAHAKPTIILLCSKCTFKCRKQSDYDRHVLTAKHKMMTQDDTIRVKNATIHDCVCGKSYAHRQGLCKHKKNCSLVTSSITIQENPTNKHSMMDIITQNKDIMDMLVLQNKEIVLQNKEMVLQNKEQAVLIKEQSETIRDMIPKIGNNNNNTTNNNQFNLQVFLNEDCKDALNFSEFIETIKVSFSDLENQAENGYVKGISKLFIESLQSLGINNRPIHCTDKKRKTLYIKENNEWDKEGSQDILKKGIQQISGRTFEEFVKSKEDNAEEYKDADSEFSEKCLLIQRNLVPNFPRETTINKVIENITQNTGILEK